MGENQPNPGSLVPSKSHVVETDFLIVGAGVAGSALACFLASHGLKAIMISNALGTSDTPRAHLLNMAGMECLRAIGLEEDCLKVGNAGEVTATVRWCKSMSGEEYGRVRSWGSGREHELEAPSPCQPLDLPQTELEPILVRYATHHGVTIEFNTSFVDFRHVSIRSRYLFGCDGARSVVAQQLNLPFFKNPSMGVAYNVLFNADIGHIIPHQKGHLNWIMQADKEHRFGATPLLEIVKPWKQWMLVCFPQPGVVIEDYQTSSQTNEALIQHIKEAIGDDNIPVELLDVSSWMIWLQRCILMVGMCNAAHRHPPIFGLGSNTCLQDAYNLAWKVAYVTKGLAGKGLLESYDAERQPVGTTIVKEANEGLRSHAAVWESLGMFGKSVEERRKLNAELSESTAAGVARRGQLSLAIKNAGREVDSLEICMNQRYMSNAVYLKDEAPRPTFAGDSIMEVDISTYPGNRLPHAWLSRKIPSKPISTVDLVAGFGSFLLLAGHGGGPWKSAAAKAETALDVPIRSVSIGWGLDYHDIYREWQVRSQIEDSGCVLVRPDGFVAWRVAKMVSNCEEKLLHVLKSVLST